MICINQRSELNVTSLLMLRIRFTVTRGWFRFLKKINVLHFLKINVHNF